MRHTVIFFGLYPTCWCLKNHNVSEAGSICVFAWQQNKNLICQIPLVEQPSYQDSKNIEASGIKPVDNDDHLGETTHNFYTGPCINDKVKEEDDKTEGEDNDPTDTWGQQAAGQPSLNLVNMAFGALLEEFILLIGTRSYLTFYRFVWSLLCRRLLFPPFRCPFQFLCVFMAIYITWEIFPYGKLVPVSFMLT